MKPSEFVSCHRTTVSSIALRLPKDQNARELCSAAVVALGKMSPSEVESAIAIGRESLRLQVSQMAGLFGYSRWQDPLPDDLLRMQRFIAQCGIGTPAILRKLAAAENTTDMVDRADAYITAVRLFVEATYKHTSSFPCFRQIHRGKWDDNEHYCVCTRRRSGVIRVYKSDWQEFARTADDRDPGKEFDEGVGQGMPVALQVDIAEDDTAYFGWMRVLLGYSCQRLGEA